MVLITALRKNKIHLQDYDYQADIQKRLLLSHLSVVQVELLEEILFHRLEIPIEKLQKQLPSLSEEQLLTTLEELLPLGLYSLDATHVHVDKEQRKYYETQLMKFDEEFKPDMDCLLHLLKKVPIHFLPVWYSIPKSSNNIFQSIIDKFLLTPQIYQRYQSEIGYHDPIFTGIMEEVFSSPCLKVYADDLKKKYGLSDSLFQEYVLHLEFNFICTLGYTRTGDVWEEILTPFYEWKEFLLHTEKARPCPIANQDLIDQLRFCDFAFVEDMTKVLQKALQKPFVFQPEVVINLLEIPNTAEAKKYTQKLQEHLSSLQLVHDCNRIQVQSSGKQFLEKSREEKALWLYRNLHHRVITKTPIDVREKQQRETEKSIKMLGTQWVYFEDFVKSSLIAFEEKQKVRLKRKNLKAWHYCLPQYSAEDKSVIHDCIFALFRCGMVKIGQVYGKDCFCLTSFGKTFLA